MCTEIKNIQIWQEGGGFESGSLFVAEGEFVAPCAADCVVDGQGMLAIPGLVDIHTHGRLGVDFTNATYRQLLDIADDFARHGVTSLTPALASASFDEWKQMALRVAACPHPAYVGLHLEGRYLSPARRGAHAPALLTPPNADEVLEISDDISPLPLRVTYAPELEGAAEFAARLSRCGIALSVGHTDADYQTTCQALANGANAVTHLFNTMPPLHHRAGGAIAAALMSDAYTELICDGFHVAPEMVKLAYRMKGKQRLVLVSDSMEGTGCPDGEYSIAGQPVKLENGEAYTLDGHIAGSTLNLLDGVRNLSEFAEISFADAVFAATAAPAALLGLSHIGSLRVGARADLLLLDGEGKRGDLPARVLQCGEWLAS